MTRKEISVWLWVWLPAESQPGARPVLAAFTEEVSKRNLQNVTIAQTGCIGICQYEPVVEVYEPGKEKGYLCKNDSRNGS